MTTVDAPLGKLRRRGFSLSGLARAHGLDHTHFRNALHGRTPLVHDEMVALTAALDMPITEVLPEDMLERALR